MALISYQAVKAAAGATGDMTAAQIATALGTYFNDAIRTSYEKGVNKVYDKWGFSLTQDVEVVRTEYVGLTEDLAQRLAQLHSDNTASYKWYCVYGATVESTSPFFRALQFDTFELVGGPTDGNIASWKFRPGGNLGSNRTAPTVTVPNITNGVIVEATASRTDDGGCWAVVATQTTYVSPMGIYGNNNVFVPVTNPSTYASNTYGDGLVLSVNTQGQFLYTYSDHSLTETTTTTVAEYRHLTSDQASTIRGQAHDSSWNKAQYRATSSGESLSTMAVRSGSSVTVSTRYDESLQEWTATKTTTAYSHNFVSSGAGWYDGGSV